jgi:hypothetical protein
MTWFKVTLSVDCLKLLSNEHEKLRSDIISKKLYKHDFQIDSIEAQKCPQITNDFIELPPVLTLDDIDFLDEL